MDSSRDDARTIEKSSMSVAEILAEYWAGVEAEESVRLDFEEEFSAPVPPADVEPEEDEEGVRIYRPRNQRPAVPARPIAEPEEIEEPEECEEYEEPEEYEEYEEIEEYEEYEEPQDDGEYEEPPAYEEPWEAARRMSVREILAEYWAANPPIAEETPPAQPEEPEEEPIEEPTEDEPLDETKEESVEEEEPIEEEPADEEPEEPENYSVRDILKEYWADQPFEQPPVPEEPEEEPAPEEPEEEAIPEMEETPPSPEPEPEEEEPSLPVPEAEEEPSFSVRDILRDFWESHPALAVEEPEEEPVTEVEPQPEMEEAPPVEPEEPMEAEEPPAPPAAYSVRDILSEYWQSGEEPLEEPEESAGVSVELEESEEEAEKPGLLTRLKLLFQSGQSAPEEAPAYPEPEELTIDQKPDASPEHIEEPEPPEEELPEAWEPEDGKHTVDDILSEFKASLEGGKSPEPEETVTATVPEPPRRRSHVSAMAEEARAYIASMTEEDYAALAETDRVGAAAASLGTVEAARPASDEVDPRFNLGGRRTGMYFGDTELDLSADESYVPPEQNNAELYHWVQGEEESAPEEPETGLLAKLKGLGRKPKKQPLNAPVSYAPEDYYYQEPPTEEELAAAAEEPTPEEVIPEETAQEPIPEEPAAPPRFSAYAGFADTAATPADYAPDLDYAPSEEEPAPGEEGAFPSFGQYLGNLVTGLLVRLRGAGSRAGAATMEEDDEDLGPELSAASASRYYGAFVRSLRLRFQVGLAVLLVLAWISLGLPVTGMLKSIQVAAALCLALQLTLMLLSLDVVTGAAINLARGRFGADSLAVLTCVLTSLDALAVALDGFGSPHMPLCLISSLSLMGVLLSSLLSARGLRKALRVPAIGKRCYTVTGEEALKGREITLLKAARPATGFVRRSEEAPPDETAFLRVAPMLTLLSLLLTLVVVIAKKGAGDFLYILTALLCPAVPATALLCFALPYFIGTMRIFSSGAAVAGWSGLCDIGRSQNLIVTDRDLFPEGSVEIETIRIFADISSEKIISYAGTMISASGSGIASCFAELMEKNNCTMRHVENFEILPGGGMKGIIDGEVVLCGSTDLMRLMNVRIPYRLVTKTTVLLAVDGVLYGIFNMKYQGQPQVRRALIGLIRSSRHPIFAIRDFNVTPEMLHNCFDVATDGYDFPPYVERFTLSEAKPSEASKAAAVICREGLGPLVHMADTGRGMYVATRINLLITVLAAVIGVIAVFVRFLSTGAVSVWFLLLFLLLWALPVAVVSVFLRF